MADDKPNIIKASVEKTSNDGMIYRCNGRIQAFESCTSAAVKLLSAGFENMKEGDTAEITFIVTQNSENEKKETEDEDHPFIR